ncbi:MAG: hypothetical protein HC880_08795 [Bacteroidia bacterium]|nr:hypothetical protein [Bacteroidia bacterium]
MKILRITTAILLGFSFILKPQELAHSTCGGFDYEAYPAYSFFAPLSFSDWINLDHPNDDTQQDNIKAWQEYFANQVPEADIAYLVYEAPAEDLLAARQGKTPASLSGNAVVAYCQQRAKSQILDYLYYAKRCEPHALYDDVWNNTPRDLEHMQQLIIEGQQTYHNPSLDSFLKLRYAYQTIRMAHYAKQYRRAVELYDQLAAPLFDQSTDIIRYWALAHRAGALQWLGQRAEAAYLFSRVFEECPSKQISSFLSFEIKTDSEWQQCLALCQNDEEKINLYFMRALGQHNRVAEEMRNIYALNPQSEKLDFLLVREINKLENSLLDADLKQNLLFINSYQAFPEQEAIKQLMEVKGVISEFLKDQKLARPDLWQLADGYLEYVAGNPQRHSTCLLS